VGNTPVYVTIKSDQQVFAWFEGRGFFIVTTHRDYEFPRTLLRRIIETKGKIR
jgi:phosphatidate phosphatase APP1